MNIFVLSQDPVQAAKWHCDKHVVKMALESVQMLSTALWRYGEATSYKPAHQKHPCTLWAGDSRPNFSWLVAHSEALHDEYTARYGRTHASRRVLNEASRRLNTIPLGEQTTFVQAMPEEYKSVCAVEAYRKYYLGEKMSFAKWKRNRPEWSY